MSPRDDLQSAFDRKVQADRHLTHALAEYARQSQSEDVLESLRYQAACAQAMARLVLYCRAHVSLPLAAMSMHYLKNLADARLLNQPVPRERPLESSYSGTHRKILRVVVEKLEAGKGQFLTVSQVRQLAPCSDPTIYAHFGNFPNLIVAGYEHVLRDISK